MKRPVTIAECVLAALLLLGGLSFYAEHRNGHSDARQTVLHDTTIVAQTVLVERKGDAAKATVAYRTLRDTTLLHLTDTLLVKQTIARADTVITKDSAALHAADVVIAAKDAELREALKPRYAPRLTTTVAALYDPIRGEVSAGAQSSFRVIGGLSLIARVDQRAALGERPQARLGVSFAF